MLPPTICSAPSSSRQRRGHGIEGGHVREALTLTPPLFDIPECRSALAKVLRRILGPQHRQLLRGPIRKRPEQNGIQDAEHGGVGANRQRQCGGRGHRKSRTLAKRAGRVAEILARLVEPCRDPDAPRVLLCERDVPKLEPRLTARFLGRHAPVDVVLRLPRDVVPNVVVQVTQCPCRARHGVTPVPRDEGCDRPLGRGRPTCSSPRRAVSGPWRSVDKTWRVGCSRRCHARR